MFRRCLPVALCLFAAFPAKAEPPCLQTQDQNNCARVLACVGGDGAYFDGRSKGWNTGTVTGRMDDGTTCSGQWTARGPFGFGLATLICQDGVTAQAIYYYMDGLTGTAIGSGSTSDGRAIRIWSGQNVLRYLTPKGTVGAKLPCGANSIPVG
ncbi:MAG: hypothetical protein ACRBBS_18035 [Thalassovita sp.]